MESYQKQNGQYDTEYSKRTSRKEIGKKTAVGEKIRGLIDENNLSILYAYIIVPI